jgi:hypothetical protein
MRWMSSGARAHRWDPGGDIMIHGLPNVLKHEPEYYAEHNWTDGCIAPSNADMAEIWRLNPAFRSKDMTGIGPRSPSDASLIACCASSGHVRSPWPHAT